MNLPVIFWGSSELSLPFLELLYKNYRTLISAVITQPPRPKGRGLILQPNIIHLFSEKLNLEVFCPEDVNDKNFIDILVSKNPQLSIVVSFGKILSKEIINLHKIGMLNVHFSLLPKYRGAAPIQWSLINGEKVSGVTIFWIEEKLDAGKIFLQKSIQVEENDNYYSLSDKLIKLGCEMLEECILRIVEGKVIKEEQVGEISYAPEIKKSIRMINWNKKSDEIHNLVRALVHWPKMTTRLKLKGKVISIKILQTEVLEQRCDLFYDCGSIVKIDNNDLIVRCGDATLLKIIKIQPENKRIMSVKEFLCGHKIKVGEKFF